MQAKYLSLRAIAGVDCGTRGKLQQGESTGLSCFWLGEAKDTIQSVNEKISTEAHSTVNPSIVGFKGPDLRPEYK